MTYLLTIYGGFITTFITITTFRPFTAQMFAISDILFDATHSFARLFLYSISIDVQHSIALDSFYGRHTPSLTASYYITWLFWSAILNLDSISQCRKHLGSFVLICGWHGMTNRRHLHIRQYDSSYFPMTIQAICAGEAASGMMWWFTLGRLAPATVSRMDLSGAGVAEGGPDTQ
jgi:hypothetical protein